MICKISKQGTPLGGFVVSGLHAPNAEAWVRSLVRELRFHILCGIAKILKIIK